jgi:hypothetical protein
MNCKPGDLAVIVSGSKTNPQIAGMFCEVLYLAPSGNFRFPNGVTAPDRVREASWLIKFATRIPVHYLDGVYRPSEYAVCIDSKLRPIRDTDGQDETLTWAPVPSKEFAGSF